MLTTGNAGGTAVVVDGVATPVPGGTGAVRRDLPLDPDLIKAGKLAQPRGRSRRSQTARRRPAAPHGPAGVALPNGARSATQ